MRGEHGVILGGLLVYYISYIYTFFSHAAVELASQPEYHAGSTGWRSF